MAPAGRPPYTQAQINAMSTEREKTRARAELNSYIARMKREAREKEQRERWQRERVQRERKQQEKGQQEGEQQEQLAQPSTGHHNSDAAPGSSPAGSYALRGRGASNSNRGGSQRERDNASFHPYQRPPPPDSAPRFKNRTVVFNKPGSSADTPGNQSTSAPGSALPSAAHSRENSRAPSEPKQLCATFTSTGLCTRYGCPLLHDPDKQALCKRWLYKNDCKLGDHCALSHEPSPHNVPTCLHFQQARCTNEECRFAHIRVNPAAQVCDAFGRLGYCEKGGACADLHAYECPDFANKGECIRGDKCPHRHVRRASRMRKTTIRSSSPEDQSEATPAEAESIKPQAQSLGTEHLFAQQEDYVPLDAEG